MTGGGRGIGEMIAEGYVANGAKVSLSPCSLRSCASTRLTVSVPLVSRSISRQETSRRAKLPQRA